MRARARSASRRKEKKQDSRRTRSPSRVSSYRWRIESKPYQHGFSFFRTIDYQRFPLRCHLPVRSYSAQILKKAKSRTSSSWISRSSSRPLSGHRSLNSGNPVKSSEDRTSRSLTKGKVKDSAIPNQSRSIRTRAIQKKKEQIEEVYQRDCDTFSLVVKMLLAKEPSLEKHIKASLQENLKDIGKRCIQAMECFIQEYDFTERGGPKLNV